MFRTLIIAFLALLSPVLVSCEKLPDSDPDNPQDKPGIIDDKPVDPVAGGKTDSLVKEWLKGLTVNENTMPSEIKITVSGKTLPVKIEDNAATRALVEALKGSSITYEADDYGGFEKVGALGRTLPASDTQITASPGDVILYNGSQIVLFYGKNSWSYTRLGKIQYGSTDELKSFLKAGAGKISVTLSL